MLEQMEFGGGGYPRRLSAVLAKSGIQLFARGPKPERVIAPFTVVDEVLQTSGHLSCKPDGTMLSTQT